MEDLQKRMRASELPMRYRSGEASFATFDAVAPARRTALAAVRAWANGTATRPWVYLFGPVGTGKTHLSASALHEAIRVGRSGRFVSLVDLLGRMRRTFSRYNESDYDVLEAYRSAGHLVVDDLGTEKPTTWAIQTLTDLVNHRYESGRPTIFTSNYTLTEIATRLVLPGEEKAAERIVDRIAELAIAVPLGGKSYRGQE